MNRRIGNVEGPFRVAATVAVPGGRIRNPEAGRRWVVRVLTDGGVRDVRFRTQAEAVRYWQGLKPLGEQNG